MQSSPGRFTTGHSSKPTGEFLIPDLCAPRAVFVMVLLVELMVLVYTLASSSLPRFDWDLLATCSLFVQWVVLLSAAMLCPLRSVFTGLSLQVASVFCLLLVMTVAGFSSLVAMGLSPQLGIGDGGVWWLWRNVLIAMVLAGMALRYFYLQQQLQAREKSELQARLDSLRARIRPHFLFNTMNSIASLIGTRPAAAEQAVEDLSELFRASLHDSNHSTTVADELHLCELYLGIEQLRLGDRLSVRWQVDNSLDAEFMPGLLLQPLVENAVYHGIAQLPAGGEIFVELTRVKGKIRVRVENPTPEQPGYTEGHHMALVNIEQRLQGLYGAEAGIEVKKESNYHRVQLHYPLGDSP
jgi:two-component system sensor histidine kinase AlgZ